MRTSWSKSENAAYNKLERSNSKYFKIWVISLLIFTVVTLVVGILTAPD